MSRPTRTGTSELLLADLIDELARRLQSGERIDLDQYLRQYPDYAQELQDLLPTLSLLAELGRAGESASSFPSQAAEDRATAWGGGPHPAVLGDFRIQREIGRGGMGIVYEAEQIPLRRRVALKVLPLAAMLDPRLLQRFRNEALAAASLDHPNIVRIYSVGCDRGIHFYAMEYIEGQTLAEAVRQWRQRSGEASVDDGELPSTQTWEQSGEISAAAQSQGSQIAAGPADIPPREDTKPGAEALLSTKASRDRRAFFRLVASLGVQAAEALEHAHRMGVVHRDIKPSNLLVDASGHLWITDFGLAVTRSATNLTVSGDIVGTLRYMSPEQVTGQRRLLDQHTDIYSLGATLYELLTLRPAFPGTDRQRLVHQIVEEEPAAPRRIRPAIPRDLETVVLKAMAKAPEARYATAQALADDLRRFLEDKPVEARRPTLAERAAKWARRHRPLVWLTAVFLALAWCGAAVAAVLIWQKEAQTAALALANDRGQRLQSALAGEEQARRIAEKHAKEAEMRRGQAFRALQENIGTHNDVAAAADILWTSGRLAEAERLYRSMVSVWEALADVSVEEVAVQGQALGWCYLPLGELLQASGRFEEGEKVYRRGVALYERLAAGQPALAFLFLWEAAQMEAGLARLLTESGQLAEASVAYRGALAKLEAAGPDQPYPYLHAVVRADIHQGMGEVCWARGEVDEAKQHFRQSRLLRERWAQALPDAREPIQELALLLADCPDAEMRDPARAVVLARKAAALDAPKREPRRYAFLVWHTLGVACYHCRAFQVPGDVFGGKCRG